MPTSLLEPRRRRRPPFSSPIGVADPPFFSPIGDGDFRSRNFDCSDIAFDLMSLVLILNVLGKHRDYQMVPRYKVDDGMQMLVEK